MREQEKKINIAFDINKELQKQISNIKLIKYAAYGFAVVGSVLAIGFLAKVSQYTIQNINELKKTLKE